jgi:threonine/homoserine/homoserine lactone efflux protein
MTWWMALLTGGGLGLAGGAAPGPLTALVLTRTLRYGPREGARVALAPVLTDGPLLIASAVLAGALSEVALGLISLAGAAFLVLLGFESLRAGPLDLDALQAPAGGVWRAVLTNLLNPHPYIFWIAIGGPLVAQAADAGVVPVVAFLVGFFGALCGAKIAMALLAGWARQWLTGSAYVWLLRGLGVVMWVFAAGFVWDALGRLGLR